MRVDSDDEAYVEKCWFCEAAQAQPDAAATVEMHTGGFAGKGREYRVLDTTTVPVPRCARCKAVHDRLEGRVAKGGAAGLLVGVVAGLVTLNLMGVDSVIDFWRALLIEVILFGMAGGVLAWALGRRSLPEGVKDQRARELYPGVRQKTDEGWTVGPKPPGL
jgi:hypothetical protein